ncbi:MAG TPA: TetR/AcrR family transcriptional regulator [Nocardioides sp.]|nr:TetR/AcrR family transcriptional regulator [Nocardioides sp.]
MAVTHRDPVLSTRRQRGRASAIEEIKAAALDELRRHGASGVTMRGVARAIDMTPSGLYRYFDDHGALLAALSVDAHDSLSEALEAARGGFPEDDCRSRWFRGSLVLRAWALDHVDEYALVVGPRLPGVDADHPDLVLASTRLMSHPTAIVAEAIAGGDLVPGPVSLAMSRTASNVPGGRQVGPVAVRGITIGAVSALAGLVSLEAFGHLPGDLEDLEEYYRTYSLAIMRTMGFADLPHAQGRLLSAS